MPIDVVDLFAGPGGLGEGFAMLDKGGAFKIAVSAEMESSAHKTLTMRSYFRHAMAEGSSKALQTYYAYCNSDTAPHPSIADPTLWKLAAAEARQLTLGEPASNDALDLLLKQKKLDPGNTVLIGGPPCQAYSLVGRSRNLGKKGYVAEEDHRHFLYKEYLRIIAKTRPALFVMENVKGILSSRVNGALVFHDILRDLVNPSKATGQQRGEEYVVCSLSTSHRFTSEMDIGDVEPSRFIVRAEEYGIPQARHRVILLGVRKDLAPRVSPSLRAAAPRSVGFALSDLPRIRSRLSTNDSASDWYSAVTSSGRELARNAKRQGHFLAEALAHQTSQLVSGLGTGADRLKPHDSSRSPDEFFRWVRDDKIQAWLHHDARSHMASDLRRYFYASTFADECGRSPKGHAEYSLEGLAPSHANWESGKFADRFRVQQKNLPSTTITSHIAKDGHYFIHPDPTQCRSLTVREAARLQTFPDNYLFEGNRSQKYHQVGNAVPPLLASRIARLCKQLLQRT